MSKIFNPETMIMNEIITCQNDEKNQCNSFVINVFVQEPHEQAQAGNHQRDPKLGFQQVFNDNIF
jgi:hypothetical protein